MYISKYYNYCGLKNLNNREKWLKKTIESIPKGESILDAGAGELQYKKYCKNLKYTSQDFGQYKGEGKEGLQTGVWDNSKLDIISDIINIPSKDSSFDNIMCIEVLEHIPDPRLAIKEFSRILKHRGKLIITAPFCSLTHFAPYYYANGYSKYFYEKFLKENNFSIQEISYNGNYFEYLAQELHRIISTGKKYSKISILVKPIIYLIIFPLLILLNYLSKNDKGSKEILCFGLHIVATKNQ
jgi:ubiquinone/menaquinone biosynthesis C-methylase UbiE